MNTYDVEVTGFETTESVRARNAVNALRRAVEIVRNGDWNCCSVEVCAVNQQDPNDMECAEVQVAFYLDWYNGDGVEGESPDRIEGMTERQASAEARKRAKARWDNVVRVYPSDDDVISFGPSGNDGFATDQYVTVRRERP